MKSHTHSTFVVTLDVIRTISQRGDGMTVGEVQGMMFAFTYGQTKRCLDGLVLDGLLWVENVPYGRTGKNLYRVTENAAILCSDIVQSYSRNYNGGM